MMRKRWLLLILLLLPLTALAADALLVDILEGPDYTVLLTEAADGRYISVRTGEIVRCSGPWPGETFFSGIPRDGVIQLQWEDRVVWYTMTPAGDWRLSGLQDHSDDFWAVAAPFGMYEPGTGRFLVGDMACSLFDGPAGDALFDMVSHPDRTGFAVVQADAAALHAAPGGDVQACFFAGTPLTILQEQAGWLQVAAAGDTRLTGWMQAADLACGAAAADVARADVRFTLPESEWARLPDTPPYIAIGVQGAFLLLWTEDGVQSAIYDNLMQEKGGRRSRPPISLPNQG